MTTKRRKPFPLSPATRVQLTQTIVSVATTLDVDHTMIASMLDTAYDQLHRDFAEPHTALLYRFMRDVFTLFHFTDDDYDAMQALLHGEPIY